MITASECMQEGERKKEKERERKRKKEKERERKRKKEKERERKREKGQGQRKKGRRPTRAERGERKTCAAMVLPPVQVPDVRYPANRHKEAKKGHPGRPPEEKEEEKEREGESDGPKKNTGTQKRRTELPVANTETRQKRTPGTNQEQFQNKKRSSCPKTFQETTA